MRSYVSVASLPDIIIISIIVDKIGRGSILILDVRKLCSWDYIISIAIPFTQVGK